MSLFVSHAPYTSFSVKPLQTLLADHVNKAQSYVGWHQHACMQYWTQVERTLAWRLVEVKELGWR
jgi:hypothetical protein